MHKREPIASNRCFLIALLALACGLVFPRDSCAQGTNFLDALSPKLHRFLVSHPGALEVLTNAYAEAAKGREIQLMYFYTDDEALPRALHYYPSESDVNISIRENQEPLDEYATIVFELIQSNNQSRYQELSEKAKSDQLSKADFAQEMLKTDFRSFVEFSAAIRKVKIDQNDIANSYSYHRIANCPDSVGEFAAYIKRVSPHRDLMKEYESDYDQLRQQH